MGMEDMEIGEEEVSFEQMLNESFENIENKKVIDGIILEINDDNVLVDVGQKIEGKLYLSEVTKNGKLKYNKGDIIPVMITGSRGDRPSISHKKVIQKIKFDEFVDKYENNIEDTIIKGTITSVKSKAGFIIEDDQDYEYFMPISQSYLKTTGAIGKEVKAKVLKVNEAQNSIIVSRKKFIEDEKISKQNKIDSIISKDEPIKGIVKKITSYGMFIDIGGIDGLVNYNEISYKGPVNPSKYYKENDEVLVRIISYDKNKQHLSLSIKNAIQNPWEEIRDQLDIGDTINVIVSNFETYGAFVDLGNDIEGLLHISEISWSKNIKKPEEVLTLGSEIDVEVIELDIEKRRLRVSLKNLLEKPFDKFIKNNKLGDLVKGKISTITDFGAFINLDGIDGLLHNDEISWNNNDKCKDKFTKDQEIETKIIKIDKIKQNISLSIKDMIPSPIDDFEKDYKIGDIVKGTIKDIKEFGVFVKIYDNLDGLIKKEDLGVLKQDELKNGEEIESILFNIDRNRNRIRLSVKRLQNKKEKEILSKVNDNSSITLGDMIKDQLK
jgi:small subunit ribosomal protein S1